MNKLLDREKTPSLNVTVVAKDNGIPQLSSIATVHIDVQDINDNTPVFVAYSTVYSISEDADVGEHIATISATDKDLKDFGTVVYYFDVSNDDGKLIINRTTVSFYKYLLAMSNMFAFDLQLHLTYCIAIKYRDI